MLARFVVRSVPEHEGGGKPRPGQRWAVELCGYSAEVPQTSKEHDALPSRQRRKWGRKPYARRKRKNDTRS